MSLARCGDGLDLFRCVHNAGFSRLRDGDHSRLWKMNILPLGRELVNGIRRELSTYTLCDQQLRTVRKELRCAAFIRLHVRSVATDYAMIGLAKRRQRKRIGRGPIEHEEKLAISFKKFPKGIRRARRPLIVTVGRRMTAICALHRSPCIRADTRVVVTCKLLR